MTDKNIIRHTKFKANTPQPYRKNRGSIATAIIAGGMVVILSVVGIGTDFGWRTKRQLENQITGKTRIEGASYKGEMDWGIFEGVGTLTCDSGVTLSGNWDDNYLQGEGTAQFDDGSHYEGEYKNTLRSGQGSFTWDNGDIYTGEWKDDSFNGEGTYTWNNGDVYTGSFTNGIPTGDGEYHWANGDVCIGSYKKSAPLLSQMLLQCTKLSDGFSSFAKSLVSNGNLAEKLLDFISEWKLKNYSA